MITLTIVIPVFNEENYLKDCLDAIAKQTIKPEEVIVVNNNSSDKSQEIAESYEFVTVLNEEKQGIVYARNTGYNVAKSEIIARIDADTQLYPGWVEYVKNKASSLKYNEAVTGPCDFYNTKHEKFYYISHRLAYFWLSRLVFNYNVLWGSNMFFFKKMWEEIKDDLCIKTGTHEDMDLASFIIKSGGKVHFDKQLKAQVSNRRFHNWKKYPGMFYRTWKDHGLFFWHRNQPVNKVD